MKIKTNKLVGSPLDWAVAVCEGHNVVVLAVQEQKERWFQHVEPKDREKEQKAFADHIEETLRPEIRVLSDDGYKRYPTHQEAPMLFGQGLPSFRYSTNWSQGGPIIEREGIELLCNLTAVEAERFSKSRADWQAFYRHRRRTEERSYATTPLVAAMRCYVASKLGDEVDVPETLL